MGYCIQLVDQKFTIKKENKAKALEAIRALAKQTSKMSGGSWGPGGQERSRHFSWVTTDDFVLAKTLEAALEAWRYEALFHHKDEKNEGDVVGINFSGEKLGDDKVLLDAIAPFVEDGSFLQFSGEDGGAWRWVFKDGKCTEKAATWEE